MIAIVSGGSSGIGAATCSLLADRGWKVWSVSRRVPPDGRVNHVEFDLVDCSLLAEALRLIPEVDALVHCAGCYVNGPTMEVNVDALYRLVEVCADRLVASKGVVIEVSSYAAGRPEYGRYAKAKKAAEEMALDCARKSIGSGLRVNVVRPHLIGPTGMFASEKPVNNQYAPAGRVGTPQEVADAIVFLIENRYINGAVLPVDGGMALMDGHR